jgi:hypothetical protein
MMKDEKYKGFLKGNRNQRNLLSRRVTREWVQYQYQGMGDRRVEHQLRDRLSMCTTNLAGE